MDIILAVLIGGLYACGMYLMLRRSIVKLVIGLSILSHAANLLIFAAANVTRAAAPLVPEGAKIPPDNSADPLPQALILTSIVISFAMLAFMLAMTKRAYQTVGSDDLDEFKTTDT